MLNFDGLLRPDDDLVFPFKSIHPIFYHTDMMVKNFMG